MITNLPLLFVKGNPKSLYKMTVEELETFVPFLVHCSWGHDTVKNVEQPIWWPADVPYSDPLIRPKMSAHEWASQLRDIIKLCYKHHCSDFLLKFCEELAKNPPSNLLYVNNCDSTTSLYLKKTRRLLVTFRNENVLYDRKAARKCLLPQRQTSIAETEPADLYLSAPGAVDSSRLSPEPETIDGNDQGGFMKALGLSGGASTVPSPVQRVRPPDGGGGRERRTLLNGLSDFPFSSPAGQLNSKRQHSYETVDRQREAVERFCSAPPQSLDSLKWTKHVSRHFPVRYKKPEGHWTRLQTFPDQRRKLALDIDSQLLYLRCKPCRVTMDRWTAEEIDRYKERAARESRVEFVSVETSARKRRSRERFVEIEIPLEVIDLCSDDDDQNENVHPAPDPHPGAAHSSERSPEAVSAPDSKHPAPGPRGPEQSRLKPLRQCHDNLYASHANNVISID